MPKKDKTRQAISGATPLLDVINNEEAPDDVDATGTPTAAKVAKFNTPTTAPPITAQPSTAQPPTKSPGKTTAPGAGKGRATSPTGPVTARQTLDALYNKVETRLELAQPNEKQYLEIACEILRFWSIMRPNLGEISDAIRGLKTAFKQLGGLTAASILAQTRLFASADDINTAALETPTVAATAAPTATTPTLSPSTPKNTPSAVVPDLFKHHQSLKGLYHSSNPLALLNFIHGCATTEDLVEMVKATGLAVVLSYINFINVGEPFGVRPPLTGADEEKIRPKTISAANLSAAQASATETFANVANNRLAFGSWQSLQESLSAFADVLDQHRAGPTWRQAAELNNVVTTMRNLAIQAGVNFTPADAALRLSTLTMSAIATDADVNDGYLFHKNRPAYERFTIEFGREVTALKIAQDASEAATAVATAAASKTAKAAAAPSGSGSAASARNAAKPPKTQAEKASSAALRELGAGTTLAKLNVYLQKGKQNDGLCNGHNAGACPRSPPSCWFIHLCDKCTKKLAFPATESDLTNCSHAGHTCTK